MTEVILSVPEDPVLFHVEYLFQRNRNRRVVRIHVHDVGHVVPPFLYDRIRAEILRTALASLFLNGEQQVRLLVPEDVVVAYAGFFQQFDQFGPDRAVAFFVLYLATGFEFHFKCAFHNIEVLLVKNSGTGVGSGIRIGFIRFSIRTPCSSATVRIPRIPGSPDR